MGTRIKSNAADRLPNNKHPNMKTSTFFVLAASCALLASGASAVTESQYDASYDDVGNDFYGDAPGGFDDVYDVMTEVIPDYDPNAFENRDDFLTMTMMWVARGTSSIAPR